MIIIGEKINGSIPSVKKAIAEKDENFIRNLAKLQAEAGVNFIDVCASVEDSKEACTMKWLIELVQEVTDIPLSIDSPNANTCVNVMKYCKRPGLINSVSGEGNKMDMVFPAIANTKWEVIALLCDDTGIPKTMEKRLDVFKNIMEKAQKYNISALRMHIDPLVEMLCAKDDGINIFFNACLKIKEKYKDIHITGAASNVSFNLPVRRLVNQAFVVLAMNAGMDSVIIDPLNKDLMGMIYATEACLGMDENCIEYITAFRNGLFTK